MIYNQYTLKKLEANSLIGFAGAPSSGKDSIAELVNGAITNKSGVVDEMARKYIEKYGVPFSVFQQAIIYQKQCTRENEILSTYKYALSSSPRFLAFIYASILLANIEGDPTAAEYGAVVDLYGEAVKSLREYSFIFLCEPLDLYDEDGLRWNSREQAAMIHGAIKSFLELNGKPYTLLPKGSAEQRLEIVMKVLGAKKTNM
jgi:energy-coupling factor transporter ATP-binding protein EcfA2